MIMTAQEVTGTTFVLVDGRNVSVCRDCLKLKDKGLWIDHPNQFWDFHQKGICEWCGKEFGDNNMAVKLDS